MPKRKPASEATKPSGDKKKSARKGRPIMVWLDDAIGAGIDSFVAAQRLPPTLTDIVELALQEFLIREGHFATDPPPDPPARGKR